MQIIFACTNCQLELEVGAETIGTQVACPSCHTVLVVPRKELGPGVTIGGFQIQKLLGAGGMGQVYLAIQLSLEREVALKILPSQMSLRPEAVQRFLSEVKLLARLEHPNIVTAFEAGEDTGVLFLAMAYVRGESLEAKLKRTGPLPEAEALHLSAKIADALAYAWGQHQLLHRDIKPANILLDTNGEPKLVDLGLAKSLTASVPTTVSGMIMGTPNYMSPEQAQGLANLDCRTDIYSLGMTLYHMVSGQVPFASSSLLEVLRKQVAEQLPDPRQFNPQVSEPCVALLETMLAKEPTSRHTTWEALLADLQSVEHHKPPTQQLVKVGGSMLMRLPKGAGGLAPVPGAGLAKTIDLVPVNKSPLPRLAAIVMAVVAVLAIGLWWRERGSNRPANPAKPAPAPAAAITPAAPAKPASVVDPGQTAFVTAQEYARTKPDDFDTTIGQFERVKQAAPGTPWTEQADREISRLKTEKAKAVAGIVAKLQADAEILIAGGAVAEALQKVEEYHGAFAAETATARAELVATLKHKEAEAAKNRQADAAAKAKEAESRRQEAARATLAATLEKTAGEILRSDLNAARKLVTTALADPELQPVKTELATANDLLAQLTALPEAVLAGFEREKGKTLTVEFQTGGPKKVTVLGLKAGKIKVQQELAAGQFAEWEFGVNDLTPREKSRRLDGNATTAGMLMRGYLAIAAGNLPAAEQEFGKMGPGLGATLAATIRQRIATQQLAAKEVPAKQALAEILLVIGIPVAPTNLVEVIGAKTYTSNQVARTQALVAEFQKKYGESATAQTNAPVLEALAAVSTGETFKPVPLVEATEENIKTTLAKLRAANRLDSPPVYRIKDGTIVLDLSKNSGLKDISALAGLPLIDLNLEATGVKNLQPLVGMPLRVLLLNGTRVRDLAPLHKLESLEDLRLMATPVADLTPLHGLMKLKHIALNSCTSIHDLSALRGLTQIDTLDISGTAIESLAPLKGIPVRYFEIGNVPIGDLSPLAGMSFGYCNLTGASRADLSGLTGTRFEQLRIGPKMKPLQLAKGMEAETLCLFGDWTKLDGLEKLPDALPELHNIMFYDTDRPPSDCPSFVFRFAKIRTIEWNNTIGLRSGVLAVDEFKAKYLKKPKN